MISHFGTTRTLWHALLKTLKAYLKTLVSSPFPCGRTQDDTGYEWINDYFHSIKMYFIKLAHRYKSYMPTSNLARCTSFRQSAWWIYSSNSRCGVVPWSHEQYLQCKVINSDYSLYKYQIPGLGWALIDSDCLFWCQVLLSSIAFI